MAQNEPKRDENKGGGGGGNSQSRQPSRAPRKSVVDSTNIMGAAVWLFSSILTAIPLMLIFLADIIPQACFGARGQFVRVDCVQVVFTSVSGLAVLGTAIVAQFLLSAMIWRLRHLPVTARVGRVIEALINFIGLYWLICVQLGSATGVYQQVSTLVKNMTIPTLIWWIVLIAAAIGLPLLEHYLFTSPPAGPPQNTQRR